MSKPVDSAHSSSQAHAPDTRTMEAYEAVIGLEVHCQLKTATKLFCGCSTRFGWAPNHQTCPVCLGHPGALPVLNGKAVDYAVRMALAVGASIRQVSVFARKQYFYPDLPKGYQISQHDLPYCSGGFLTLASGKKIRLTRIHLEEDAGKSQHVGTISLVDLNRAGTPLIEIVSEPDLRSPEEASEYLRRLHALVRHLDICDGNMEEGSFRCDANVSVRPVGSADLRTRCEIKNLNSFRNIERAITYEMSRQMEIYEAQGTIRQETLHFDADAGRTSPMRSKEESHDYRYMPDPDLRPLVLDPARIARIRAALPELPEAMAQRYQEELGLSAYDAGILTSDRDLAAYFEAVLAVSQAKVTPKIAANWVTGEFLREVNARGWSYASAPLAAESLGNLLLLLGEGTISGKIAKTIFQAMVETGEEPRAIMLRMGLVQVSDEGEILAVIQRVIDANPDQFVQFRSGKDKLFGFFVGQVMREGQGKLSPALVNTLLKQVLSQGES